MLRFREPALGLVENQLEDILSRELGLVKEGRVRRAQVSDGDEVR